MITFLVSFFIFLFCLYLFSRDDFVFLRKNISLEQIFNYAFLGLFFGLFSGRIIYIFLHPSLRYLNPLVFLVFFYFPGISLVGIVIGVLIFLFFVSQKKKIPRGRLYDIFSLSFLPAFASNVFILQVISIIFTKKISFLAIGISVLLFLFFTFFTILFEKGRMKDGLLGIITLITFSSILLLQQVLILVQNKKNIFFDKEIFILLLILIIGIALCIHQKIERRKR